MAGAAAAASIAAASRQHRAMHKAMHKAPNHKGAPNRPASMGPTGGG